MNTISCGLPEEAIQQQNIIDNEEKFNTQKTGISEDSYRCINCHGKKIFECRQVCGKKFTTLSKLAAHSNSHCGRTFQCWLCPKKFDGHYKLIKHISMHRQCGAFECDICGCKFKMLSILRRHIRTHTATQMVQCLISKAKQNRKSPLTVTNESRFRPKSKDNRKDKPAAQRLRRLSLEMPTKSCFFPKESYGTTGLTNHRGTIPLLKDLHCQPDDAQVECTPETISFPFSSKISFATKNHVSNSESNCDVGMKYPPRNPHFPQDLDSNPSKMSAKVNNEFIKVETLEEIQDGHPVPIDPLCVLNTISEEDMKQENYPEEFEEFMIEKEEKMELVNVEHSSRTEETSTVPAVLPLDLQGDLLSTIKWLQHRKLLVSEMRCLGCSNVMNWTKCRKKVDGFTWKCQRKGCKKYQGTVSVRHSSFFYQSNMSLQKWMQVLYLWCDRVPPTRACLQMNVSSQTLIYCYSFFRKICTWHFESNPTRLGGHGKIVEIGYSCLSSKPKLPQKIVSYTPVQAIGLIDSSKCPINGHMEVVQSTCPASVLPIIRNIVQPGSIIPSNYWMEYRSLLGIDSNVGPDINSINFVDPHTIDYIPTIDSYWKKQKSYIRAMHGCKHEFIQSYLYEYMWHERYSQNAFENMCKYISTYFPR